MDTARIVVLVVLPVILLAMAFITYRSLTNVKNESNESGTQLIKFDVHNFNYVPYSTESEDVLFPVRTSSKTKWIRADNVFERFYVSPEVKLNFNKAFKRLESGSDFEHVEFVGPSFSKKKAMSYYSFKFDSIDADSDILLTVKWHKQEVLKAKKKTLMSQVTLEDVIDNTSRVKTLFAFNINEKDKVAGQRLIKITSQISSAKNIEYFISENISAIIFVFYYDELKDARKENAKFVEVFKSKGFEFGANHLFEGCGFITSTKFDNPLEAKNNIYKLEFLVNKSIETKNNFISGDDSINAKELENYVEAYEVFKKTVQDGNLEEEVKVVRSFKQNRIAVRYLFPKVPGVNAEILSKIEKNKNNKKILVDAFADKISRIDIDKNEKAKLIDVSFDWIVRNKDQDIQKKAIYVIRFMDRYKVEEVSKVLDELIEKGYFFAVRVYKYNEDIAIMLKEVNAQFVVIDKRFWEENSFIQSDNLIELMTIWDLSSRAKKRLIYNNPSKLIDVETAKKIGLKLYYED